jgi:hypothetical protein
MSTFRDLFGALPQGTARANLFEVFLTPPGGEDISVFVRSASIPSVSDGEIVIPYKGRQLKFPGDRTYDSWDIQVLCDSTYKARKAFEKWKEAINQAESGVAESPNVSDVFIDITVQQLDRAHKPIATYQLKGAWVQSLQSIELSHDSTDTPATFGATISYQYYTTA